MFDWSYSRLHSPTLNDPKVHPVPVGVVGGEVGGVTGVVAITGGAVALPQSWFVITPAPILASCPVAVERRFCTAELFVAMVVPE